jgi:hypothetical protein
MGSGHGHRETASPTDATAWRDRVVADIQSEEGRAAARAHHVSIWLIDQAAALIAGYIARGEAIVSRADTVERVRIWRDEKRTMSKVPVS